MSSLIAFAAGLLFAVGLAVSGMTQPHRVIGFLDFGGAWNPSLAFVMAGAIGVHAVAQLLRKRRARPLYGADFPAAFTDGINLRLIGGALLFGVGWGLSGLCPGPAIVASAAAMRAALVFLPAMLVGMYLFTLLGKQRAQPSSGRAAERRAACRG